jgi:hypothetical protein
MINHKIKKLNYRIILYKKLKYLMFDMSNILYYLYPFKQIKQANGH